MSTDLINLFFLLHFFLFVVIILVSQMGKKGIKRDFDDEDYVMYTETHRRRRSTKKNVAAGPWRVKENEIYLNFL